MKKTMIALMFSAILGCGTGCGVALGTVIPAIVAIAPTIIELITQIENEIVPLFDKRIEECNSLIADRIKSKADEKETVEITSSCASMVDSYGEVKSDYDALTGGDESQSTVDKTKADIKMFADDETELRTVLRGYGYGK